MSVSDVQVRGIHFLLAHRNDNGGIPAVSPGDVSGLWTTASTVETLLQSPYLPKNDIPTVRELVLFLLDQQADEGGWPITPSARVVSTMATGHALSASTLAQQAFQAEADLVAKLEGARTSALGWLDSHQDHTGGWAPEPSTTETREIRTLATCYALRGYLAVGRRFDNSPAFRKAINHLIDAQDDSTGGWGYAPTAVPDPANTARVLSTLLKSGRSRPSDALVKKGLAFIFSDKRKWRFRTESYVVGSAPGQVYFHGNTLAEILELLTLCQYTGKEIRDLLEFFLTTQDEGQGHWYLRDFEDVDTSILTWTTSEAIAAIDLAYPHFTEHLYEAYSPSKLRTWKAAFLLVSALCLILLAVTFDLHLALRSWWTSLSEGWQQVIVGSVILAFLISVIANLISDPLRRLVASIRGVRRKRK